MDPLLQPHGRVWEEVDGINMDPTHALRYHGTARINWPQDNGLDLLTEEDMTVSVNFFYLCFPMQFVPSILERTNAQLENSKWDKRYTSNLSKGEFFRWLLGKVWNRK
jgi:hypothetical protein